jgi:hypothetical protein
MRDVLFAKRLATRGRSPQKARYHDVETGQTLPVPVLRVHHVHLVAPLGEALRVSVAYRVAAVISQAAVAQAGIELDPQSGQLSSARP